MIIKTRKPAGNRRKVDSRQRRNQDMLEVTVRGRRAASLRNRRIAGWVARAVVVGAAIGFAWWGIREGVRRFVFENPDFTLADLQVSSDGQMERDEILAIAKVQVGRSIFSVNLSETRRRLAAVPRVERAEIQRVLPDRIEIRVSERRPVAWVVEDFSAGSVGAENAMLLDRAGVVMHPDNQPASVYRLPVLTGVNPFAWAPGERATSPEIRAGLDLLEAASDSGRFDVRAVDLSRKYCLVATDNRHTKATFGLDKLDEQIEKLERVLDYAESNRREIQTVNLMVQRNTPVTFAPLDAAGGTARDAAPPAPECADDAAQPGGDPAKKKAEATRKTEPAKKAAPAKVMPKKKTSSEPAKKAGTSAPEKRQPAPHASGGAGTGSGRAAVPRAVPVEKPKPAPTPTPARKGFPLFPFGGKHNA